MVKRAPGSGSVYQRSDGKWVAEVPVGRGSRGYRQRKYLYASTRAAANARLRDALRALELGMVPPDGRLTVGAHLHAWLDWQRDRVRPSTWVSYEGHVRMHLVALHPVPLIRLVPDDVRRLMRRLVADGLSSTTVRYSVTVLRMALKQAVNDGLVPRNVAAAVQPPKVVRTAATALSIADSRRLVAAAAAGPLGALWTTAIATGLRQGELLGLRWSDIDLDAGVARVTGALRPIPAEFRDGGPRLRRVAPKTDHGYRAVPLVPFAVDRLRIHQAAGTSSVRNLEGYIFTTPRGTPLDGRNVYREWHRFLAESQLPRIRFHDIRHSTSSVLRALGVSIDDVRQILGHGQVEQTWQYTHDMPEVWARATAAMQEALG